MALTEKSITFIIGSGAVENAWGPVIRAINKSYGIETNQDGANFLMANEVYLLRVYSNFSKRNHYSEFFQKQKENIDKLKTNISLELLKAQESGEIKSRTVLKDIFELFTNEGIDKIGVVTTNWDEVMDIAINKIFQWGRAGHTRPIDCYHIHGSIKNPAMLYLPSEITMEPYRSKIEENIFGNDHSNFMNLLRSSHKIILYGLSLDPLDAELNVSLASSSLSSQTEEIIIINPAHELVAGRVKLLLNYKQNVKIHGYDPGNLSKKFVYR